MSFEVIATEPLSGNLNDLLRSTVLWRLSWPIFFDLLESNPTLGTPIGKNCYKIRVAISAKGRGKSGGARLITYVRILKNKIFLLDIYDKSEQANISSQELQLLIDILSK